MAAEIASSRRSVPTVRTASPRTPTSDQPGTDIAPVPHESIRELDRIADLLDTRWRVPVFGWRFGVDALVGLVPGVGDVATAAVSLWIVDKARRHGASGWTLTRMIGNVGVDTVIGAIPIIGTIFDVAYRSNRRNLEILREHLNRKHAVPPSDRTGGVRTP